MLKKWQSYLRVLLKIFEIKLLLILHHFLILLQNYTPATVPAIPTNDDFCRRCRTIDTIKAAASRYF